MSVVIGRRSAVSFRHLFLLPSSFLLFFPCPRARGVPVIIPQDGRERRDVRRRSNVGWQRSAISCQISEARCKIYLQFFDRSPSLPVWLSDKTKTNKHRREQHVTDANQ